MEENYLELNKDAWNKKTSYHIESDFYKMDAFVEGESSLNSIELDLLGDIKDKTILHLQCHFGQDSLSLSRKGAVVTGVDFSENAIEKAREVNENLGLDARFICCDIYNLPKHLNKQFDIVYTSYGTIGWLPDLDKWANVVSQFLKPGGTFVIVDFHPVVWMFDNDFTYFQYSYFKREPIVEIESGTYADVNAPIETKTISWNHSLGEILGNLINSGLEIMDFKEYDYSPYNCFKNLYEPEAGKFRIKSQEDKIPMVYSVVARLKN
jgi:SAM-dependent methyltransferase